MEEHVENQPITPFHAHEVMHTAWLFADTFERHIGEHRFVQAHPMLKEAADRMIEQLYDFYQIVGRITVE